MSYLFINFINNEDIGIIKKLTNQTFAYESKTKRRQIFVVTTTYI